MEIARAYKTELNPNDKQATFMERCVEASYFVYNIALREWNKQYDAWKAAGDEDAPKPNAYRLKKQFNAAKYNNAKHCPHYANVLSMPYCVTEGAFERLKDAWKRYWSGQNDRPRLARRRDVTSFVAKGFHVTNTHFRLTGRPERWVRLKEHDYIPTAENGARLGTYATVSQRAGRWFISVTVYEDVDVPDNGRGDVIGVDLGLKHLIVCSDGATFDRSRALEQAERKVGRLNKELARRKKGGKNWHKTKRKLQKAYWRLSNVRKHWLHHVSNYLTKERRPSAIVLEDLNVKGMMSNHHLAKALSEASFGELRRQIEYKAKPLGIDVVIVDRWYPSSKTCSRCGCVKDDLTLSDRVYRCNECGLEIDRDLNAARNLAALGKAQTEPDCVGS